MNFRIALKIVFITVLFLSLNPFAQADPRVNGKWYVTFDLTNVGFYRSQLNFEGEGDNFKAYTREGVINTFANIYNTQLAGMLTTFFKNGSIIRIDEGKISETSTDLTLKGKFNSPAGRYDFTANLINDNFSAFLTKNDQTVGIITGSRENKEKEPPPADYTPLVNSMIDTTTKYIFSSEAINWEKWTSFKDRMLAASKHIQDDVEMAFAFYYFAQDLSLSHYNLTRLNPEFSFKQNILGPDVPVSKTFEMKDYEKNTCYLKINSFAGSAREIDSLFSIINDKGYSNLIIDLRNNPGGALSAGLRTAQYLISEDLNGGIFLTRKWFDSHTNIPKPEEYSGFPTVTEANQSLFIKDIHSYEAVTIIAKPLENRFKGKVYILTSNKTASACEPLVYGLKLSKSAVIVGAKTAGAMLTGERFELGDGYILLIPTADFYTSDGKRLEGVGVTPDIEVNPNDALDRVLKMVQ